MNFFRYYDFFIYLQFQRTWKTGAGYQLPLALFVAVFPFLISLGLWIPLTILGLAVPFDVLMACFVSAHLAYLLVCFVIRLIFGGKQK